jgi:aryl-alcohol dehydrogenase-like predicted oxidoreductase
MSDNWADGRRPMSYRLLGRSGLRVSELALGAMTFSDRGLSWGASPTDSREVFDAFTEAGGTYVDTANIYGDVFDAADGASERVLADLIASDRDHFVVASKYSCSNTRDVSRSGNSFKTMRQTVDASLANLRTDRLDILWLHAWDHTTPVGEVLRAANQLITAGKVLYFGFSDTPAWVVAHAVAMADAHGWLPPVAIQDQYSLIERSVEAELLPMAQTLDLGVVAWSPLAAGILTGKYTATAEAPGGPRRFTDPGWVADIPQRHLTIALAVDQVAAELGCTPAQAALAWLRQRPGVVVPIVGARTAAQIRENLDRLDVRLSDKHLHALDEVSRPELGFPQGFLATDGVRTYSTSGHYDRLDNHHAHGYAEFSGSA